MAFVHVTMDRQVQGGLRRQARLLQNTVLRIVRWRHCGSLVRKGGPADRYDRGLVLALVSTSFSRTPQDETTRAKYDQGTRKTSVQRA